MGEKVRGREVIGDMTQRLRDEGVPAGRAAEIARDSMIRIERNESGNPPPRRPDAGSSRR